MSSFCLGLIEIAGEAIVDIVESAFNLGIVRYVDLVKLAKGLYLAIVMKCILLGVVVSCLHLGDSCIEVLDGCRDFFRKPNNVVKQLTVLRDYKISLSSCGVLRVCAYPEIRWRHWIVPESGRNYECYRIVPEAS